MAVAGPSTPPLTSGNGIGCGLLPCRSCSHFGEGHCRIRKSYSTYSPVSYETGPTIYLLSCPFQALLPSFPQLWLCDTLSCTHPPLNPRYRPVNTPPPGDMIERVREEKKREKRKKGKGKKGSVPVSLYVPPALPFPLATTLNSIHKTFHTHPRSSTYDRDILALRSKVGFPKSL